MDNAENSHVCGEGRVGLRKKKWQGTKLERKTGTRPQSANECNRVIDGMFRANR